MAYCLRSFVETLDQVLNPDQHHKIWQLDLVQKPQFQSLFENASFLQNFLDKSSPLIQEKIASLEDQIMAAAEEGANTLESHITSQILSNPEGQSFTISPPDLGQVLHAFEVARQEMIKIEDASQPVNHTVLPSVSSTRRPDSKHVVVGVEENLKKLRRRLTSARVKALDIIPIVGMGGTGKSTLAQILYDGFSSASNSHFDCRAWVTVSQSYDLQQILRTILACVSGKPLNEVPHQATNELIHTLYQTLFGRRYLIVLDDIWNCRVWDDLQKAFPKNNQGSRIILTSRENTIADYVKSESHEMHLINNDDSWELIEEKVFGEQPCLEELVEVGKTIASNCGGLPLALQVIGGLLSESPRSREFWEYVAQDVGSLIAKKDDQFSGIFSWSFAHLPHYLKPCFLYMGAFPEYAIRASKIIKLWVSEGFLKPVGDKNLEDTAEIHLKALVDRNLIFVRTMKIGSMKAKSYGIHDLLRDLCLKKANEENFLYHGKDPETNNLEEDILWFRRVSVHSSHEHLPSLKLTPHVRSFLCFHVVGDEFISYLCFKLSLLRVLDMFGVTVRTFPELILQLVNLRYLAIDVCIPESISLLRNLQTLIACEIKSLAVIAYLPQLRHLIVKWVPDWCNCDKCSGGGVCSPFDLHENLQTLSMTMMSFHSVMKLCGKLPNLRKLKIAVFVGDNDNFDLSCFYNLETFKCEYWTSGSISNFNSNLPDSLKKLTLCEIHLHQSCLNAIGMLPNLQILVLKSCTMSADWETREGGFYKLRYLHINNAISLKNWSATEYDFPVLRHLFIESCDYLKKIPCEIGEIKTLEIIEVAQCKLSVIDSARRILEEQRSFGNTFLQVYLGSEFLLDKDHGLSIKFYTFKSQTTLPRLLRNLTLECCRVPQTLLSANDELPEFQVLNIEYCRFESSTWQTFKGVFFQLQYLKIVESDLKSWLAIEIHFPILRHLVIRDCCHLKEIPNDFGKITTLEIIEVDGCKYTVFESARIILKEQRQFGNTHLQLRLGRAIDVWSSNKDEVEEGESLISKVENYGLSVYGYDLSSKITFPQSLKKLTLRFCEVPQTILNTIGALPEIEVLKLTDCSFESEDWEPFKGGFRELRYLHINRVRNLANWLATESSFPVLQHLVLQDCSHLNEIPRLFHSLKTIEVVRCKPSVFHSARRLLREERTYSHTARQLFLGSEFEVDKSWRLSLKFYTFNGETIFPHFLRNLTLECCRVPQKLLSANEELPEFQVLNIEYCRFENSTWQTFEGVFFQLQYLKIVESDVKNWLVTDIHFPALRHLVIQGCGHLIEIPKYIGRVKTLEIINVDGCKHSVFESARIILKEQRQFGNTRLQLRLGRATDVWSSKEDEEVLEEEESLIRKVENHGLSLNDYNFSGKTTFPPSLKKLTLRFCKVPQTILNAIGALPEIQVLKLSYCSFECSTWEPAEYGFCQLQYLEIAESNLENWLAADFHFPILRHLTFHDCPYLNEIPSEIGRIHTLEIIEVDECKPSVFVSAMEILKEQRDFDNHLLQLMLHRATDGSRYELEEDAADE